MAYHCETSCNTASDFVPLEQHVITFDRCIGNYIKPGIWSHHSLVSDRLLMRITTISCPTLGVTQSDCESGIDKEHLVLLLKTSSKRACKTAPLLFGPVLPLAVK